MAAMMERGEVLSILRSDNPKARSDKLVMYADAYLDYQKARANIEENGTIVAHPRTGTPLENPYMRIMDNAFARMTKLGVVKADRLWS